MNGGVAELVDARDSGDACSAKAASIEGSTPSAPTCLGCNGSGHVVAYQRHSIDDYEEVLVECPKCDGTGAPRTAENVSEVQS